jgi:hypothetical protein
MLNDSLALSDILTGLPQQADFDAIHAALMATERGRWFLAEYAERNCHAEADRPIGAFGRVETAIPGGGLPQHRAGAGAAAALSEIAAALTRIEAEMAARPRPSDGLDSIERLRDIAFVLHERSIEASLCDALDAAVRDIAAVCASLDSSAERAGRAAELLRSLKHRISEMIALTAAEPDPAESEESATPAACEGIATAAPSLAVPDREQDLSSRPNNEASARQFSSNSDVLPALDAVGVGPAVRTDNRPPRSDAVEPTAPLLAMDVNGPIGPDEDPGGLFDSDSRVDVTASRDSDMSDTSSIECAVPQPAVPKLPETVPASVSADPMAAIRALSEEELIALFS